MKAPIFVIRKKNCVYGAIKLEDFSNIMTEKQLHLLKKYIKEYKNIMIVGGTMTGKTSLLNACLREIEEISDVNEKIITIQNSPNLTTNTSNVVSVFTDFDEVSNALNLIKRLNANRIIIDDLNDSLGMYNLIQILDNGVGGVMFSVPALDVNRGLSKLNSYIEELYSEDDEYINQIETNANLIIELYKDSDFNKKARFFTILGYNKEDKRYILDKIE